MRWGNGPDHWGVISIALHWFTALAVFGMFAMGLWMTDLTYYNRWYYDAPYLHKSIGVLLFIFTLLRLAWQLKTGRPAELPNHVAWERLVARTSHILLYLLLFGVMVSGYFISTADGRPVEVFGWFAVPATISGIASQEDIAGAVHLFLASVLIALALIHAGAALKHHFIDRDRALMRMLGR